MSKADYTRYERLITDRGLTNYKVSKATGVSQETLSSWKKGKYSPKQDKISVIADYLQVPVNYFYERTDVDERAMAELDALLSQLHEVSAGTGRIDAPEGFAFDTSGSFAKVKGDSMYPSLHDGDIVRIIEVTDTVEPKDFALVRINGEELTIKHVEFTDDGMWVRGENPDAYTDRFFEVKDIVTLPVQVIGKATEIIQRKL